MTSPKNIVINSAWNSHHRIIKFIIKNFGSSKTSISTNNYKCVNSCFH